MRFRSTVPPQSAGLSLSRYLARRFTYHSEQEWIGHIVEGRVLVSGGRAPAERAVAAGEEVTYDAAPFEEPEADLAFTVVYEDERLIGVDKPGNLLVHRAGKAFTRNLVYQIRSGASGPAWPEAAAANRLDRETSGVVILVKRSGDVRRVTMALAAESAEKRYVAVVAGQFDPQRREIDAPIGRDPASPLAYRHAVRPDGKPARTRVLSVEHREGYSIVRLAPVTGRTHQIRLHCASVGCPIVGDRLYGRPGDRELLARQALHCERIAFTHPWTRQPCVIEAPVPEDMLGLIRRLGPGHGVME